MAKESNDLFKKNERIIILLLENAQVHPIDITLFNVKLFYFPPNVTSLIQRLDQVIIKSSNKNTKKRFTEKFYLNLMQWKMDTKIFMLF